MKKIILGIMLGCLTITPALAHTAVVHSKKHLPSPFTPFTPPNVVNPIPLPTPRPISGLPAVTDTNSILTGLLKVKDTVLADIAVADTEATATIPNTTPPQMWDPIAHMCFAGIGPVGDPSHVPGLVEFINSIPVPPTPPSGQSGGGLIATAENIRVLNIAARRTIQQFSSVGYPTALMQSCGSLINDAVMTVATAGGQVVAVNSLLLKYIPILAFKP